VGGVFIDIEMKKKNIQCFQYNATNFYISCSCYLKFLDPSLNSTISNSWTTRATSTS